MVATDRWRNVLGVTCMMFHKHYHAGWDPCPCSVCSPNSDQRSVPDQAEVGWAIGRPPWISLLYDSVIQVSYTQDGGVAYRSISLQTRTAVATPSVWWCVRCQTYQSLRNFRRGPAEEASPPADRCWSAFPLTYWVISSFYCGLKNISDKRCRKNEIYFTFSQFFLKSYSFRDIKATGA